MTRRPLMLPFLILLCASLVALPACRKKKADTDGGDPAPAPGPGPAVPPPAGSSDYLLYAHLNAKSIRDSAVFTELKDAFTKAGGTEVWDKAEGEFVRDLGFRPTDIDAVTAIVTEIPPRGEPKMVLIVASSKAFNKATAFDRRSQEKPDTRGFYKMGRAALLHYPDDRTAVILHPDLASQYLEGYGKDRKGWPLTPEQTRAAGNNTLYLTLNLSKVPAEVRNDPEAKEFEAALAAQSLTLTANLKGKELTVAGRATFADAATANRAKETAQKVVGMAAAQIEQFMKGKEMVGMEPFRPAVAEAHRAIKGARLEAAGSSVTLAGSYKADFDIGAMVAEFIKYAKERAPRLTAQNNLKQIGLALHNFESANGWVPIHGIGAAPKDGNALLSWRVAILPYIEQNNLYNQFRLNEPWDSAHNKKLIDQMPKIYAPVAKPGKAGYTHLQMVVGPGAMRVGGKTSITGIRDGTANTIAVAEAAEPVIWTKPDDVMLPGKELPKDLKKRFGGQFPGGFNVVMWDGSVRFIPDTVSERTLAAAISPNGGDVLGSDWNGPPPPKKGR